MKKQLLTILFIVDLIQPSFSQSGFTHITDPGNPVTLMPAPASYRGATWIDIDNDNDIDLYAAPHFLFRNDGQGNFVQYTNPFNFTPTQGPGGASWADIDNDGLPDCIIAQNPSQAYINTGNGNFNNISSQLPNFNNFPAWGCAFGDWNNDPYIDFIYVHAAGFHSSGPFPNKLYLNTNASLNLQYITGYAITDSVKPYTVPYWSDYDMDGDMDLFIASGPGGSPGYDYCYKNLKMETGLDTLERMTTELFATQLQDGQCYNFIDHDHDGDLDLCLTNYIGAQTRFYVNNGGSYSLQTMPFTGINRNLTNDWGDFDNDGDLDVLITNDIQPMRLYRNLGNGSFGTAVSLGVDSACGITNGDYDNDGDLDFFSNGRENGRALFRNDSLYGNNWINIRCNGSTSNRSAIGTLVRMKAVINGNSYWQTREISAQNSFQSQNDLRVHFGLGDATVIDSITIRYSSGQVSHFVNIAVNNFYCHDEGTASLCMVTGIHESPDAKDKVLIQPNPADSFIHVEFKRNNKGAAAWQVYDATGKVMTSGMVLKDHNLSIDISQFPQGSYHIQIIRDRKIISGSFMKF